MSSHCKYGYITNRQTNEWHHNKYIFEVYTRVESGESEKGFLREVILDILDWNIFEGDY